MLDIQIVSDLHIEFWANKKQFNFIKPAAAILALLGDICCCGNDADFELFKRFINEVLPLYEQIIFISGNHEYYFNSNAKPTYKNTMEGIDEKIKEYFKATSNKLHYLNNNTIKLSDGKETYIIIGSTLWSWIPETRRESIQSQMNDYSFIYYNNKKPTSLTSNRVAEMFINNVKFIKQQIAKYKDKHKIIIFTHHKPYISTNYNPNSLSVAYESDLSFLFDKYIKLWAYGHTHIADSSVHKKVWFYSNPKGYPSQKTNYKKNISIKV
jgi:3',5'-cyclic AMP phosphodiesterase CpdA